MEAKHGLLESGDDIDISLGSTKQERCRIHFLILVDVIDALLECSR